MHESVSAFVDAQGAWADGSAGVEAARAEASALRCQLEGYQARKRELTAQGRTLHLTQKAHSLGLHSVFPVLQAVADACR